MPDTTTLTDCTGCVGGDPTDTGRTHAMGTRQHPYDSDAQTPWYGEHGNLALTTYMDERIDALEAELATLREAHESLGRVYRDVFSQANAANDRADRYKAALERIASGCDYAVKGECIQTVSADEWCDPCIARTALDAGAERA